MALDYTYYNQNFPKLTVEEFNKLLPAATKWLSAATHRRADVEVLKASEDYAEWKLNQVNDCLCNIINKMSDISDESGSLKSVSNDGYSESYLMNSEISSELLSEARKWLSGTGLTGVL